MADEQKKETAPTPEKTGGATAEKKNKKIRFMNKSELDAAIEKTQKSQGSLNSKYAIELLKQKEILANIKKQ